MTDLILELANLWANMIDEERPLAAKSIQAAIERLKGPAQSSTGSAIPEGATHIREPEYITAWLFDGVSTMPLWLIEKYKSIPIPEPFKGRYATAIDGEFWRWMDVDQFNRFFVPIPSNAQAQPSCGGKTWTPDEYWEYVSGLAGEFEAGQMRDMLAERGLQIVGIGDAAYTGWLPVANYPDDNSAVLVANPEEGRLPVVAWKVEDTWYHYNGERKPLDPQPTIWTEWPKLPKASPLSSTDRGGA